MAEITITKKFWVDDVLTDMTSVTMNAVAVTSDPTGVYTHTFTGLTVGDTFSCTIVYVYDGETYTETESETVTGSSEGNKTCADLIDAIRLRAGRQNDNSLITEAFVLEALNDGQIDIARKCPGLIGLDERDETSITVATDDTTVDISTLDPAHISRIWILNGTSTRRAGLKYVEPNRFFEKYIRVADISASEPTIYTRRGSTLYFNCPVASDYDGLYLRIDYTKWPDPFASVNSTARSDLARSNRGLIFFAEATVFDEMALSNPKVETKALKKWAAYKDWLSDYQDYNDVQTEELF